LDRLALHDADHDHAGDHRDDVEADHVTDRPDHLPRGLRQAGRHSAAYRVNRHPRGNDQGPQHHHPGIDLFVRHRILTVLRWAEMYGVTDTMSNIYDTMSEIPY